jgi:thiol-disulfide isomerase/thioredoxin
MFNSPNIYYLEDSDFTPDYRLQSNVMKNGRRLFDGKTVLMVQGNYCGYCTQFKPIFQQVADQLHDDMDFATIEIDGKLPSEQLFKGKDLEYIIQGPLEGVPYIVKMYQGMVIPSTAFTGDRNYESFLKYCLN